MVLFPFSFDLNFYLFTLNVFTSLQDQEDPEVEVEGENGNSADEASPNPQRDSQDQSPPVTDQIPPLDNSDTVDNESTKLLNEESD